MSVREKKCFWRSLYAIGTAIFQEKRRGVLGGTDFRGADICLLKNNAIVHEYQRVNRIGLFLMIKCRIFVNVDCRMFVN